MTSSETGSCNPRSFARLMQSATASLEQERLVAIDRWLNPPQYNRRISLKLVIIDLLGLISTCYACISKVYHRLVPTGRIFSVGWLGFYRSTGWEPSANSYEDDGSLQAVLRAIISRNNVSRIAAAKYPLRTIVAPLSISKTNEVCGLLQCETTDAP